LHAGGRFRVLVQKREKILYGLQQLSCVMVCIGQ
jgi:hypothetical protein